MDEFSSQLQLVPKRHLQKSVRSTPHSVRRKKTEETKDKSVVFVLVLLILAVIAVTCIVGFYISHIQEHVRRLEQRIIMLEQRPCAQPNEALGEERHDGDVMEDDVKLRLKRGIYEQEESEHRRMYHHGIASHNIALIFGTGDNIDVNNTQVQPEHKFRPDPRNDNCDGTLYLRKDKQKFCTVRSTHRRVIHPTYQMSAENQLFYYFQKAAWMQDLRSEEYYSLSYDGKITVEKSGIYIIHANVHFVEVDSDDTPEYAVYKTDDKGRNHDVVSKCVVTPLSTDAGRQDAGVYPCSAWQLLHLDKGEMVYISIGSFVWFRVEKETFHLALIRLNEEEL